MSEKIKFRPEAKAEFQTEHVPPLERFEQLERSKWQNSQRGDVEMLKSWEIRSDEKPLTFADMFPTYFPKTINHVQPRRREMVIVESDGKAFRYFDINPNNYQYSEYEISERTYARENNDPVSSEHNTIKGQDSWELKAAQVKHKEKGCEGDVRRDKIELREGEIIFARNIYKKPWPPMQDTEEKLENEYSLPQYQLSAFGIVDRCRVQAEASRRQESLNTSEARFMGIQAIEDVGIDYFEKTQEIESLDKY